MESLRRASALTDPDSPEANAERAILARQLEQNLAARGLTGSGTELAGITDNEVKLTRERNNLLLGLAGQGANTLQSLSSLQSGLGQNLAGISQGLGSAATSLFGNLGASSAGTLLSGATNAANLRMAGDNAATQGWIGVGNAAQGTAQNLLSLARQRQLTTQGNYSPFINSNKGVTLGDLAFVG
ncbi:MAG: hypothetical protein KDD13_00325 [Mangrovimonas sp.]|nr:hypothetical protein [Mangrovimonas sp.]